MKSVVNTIAYCSAAFIAFVCLVAMAVSQDIAEPTTAEPPISTTADSPVTDPIDPPVVCDVSLDDDDTILLLPDPNSCENFYACNHGLPILMACPKGLHFNPILSLCDWPEHANCAAQR